MRLLLRRHCEVHFGPNECYDIYADVVCAGALPLTIYNEICTKSIFNDGAPIARQTGF